MSQWQQNPEREGGGGGGYGGIFTPSLPQLYLEHEKSLIVTCVITVPL